MHYYCGRLGVVGATSGFGIAKVICIPSLSGLRLAPGRTVQCKATYTVSAALSRKVSEPKGGDEESVSPKLEKAS